MIIGTPMRGTPPDAVAEALSRRRDVTTILVPVLNLRVAGEMIELAASLAGRPATANSPTGAQTPEKWNLRIAVLGVVEVPPDQPLTSGLDMARSYRALLDFLPDEVEADGRKIRVEHLVKVDRDVPAAVRQAVAEEGASLVLFYWKGHTHNPRRHVYGRILDAVLRNPPCDVALVRPEEWRNARRVLLPVRGGPSAEKALEMGLAFASRAKVPITVFHNVPSVAPRRNGTVPPAGAGQAETLGEAPYLVFNDRLREAVAAGSVPVESVLTKDGDPGQALLAEAREHDLVIMGSGLPFAGEEDGAGGSEPLEASNVAAATRPGDRPKPLPLRVAEKGCPIVLLRAAEAMDLSRYVEKAQTGRVKRISLDSPFEHWFVESTYHADEFRDVDEIVKLKRASGLTLSVALLTSNDARHIHSIITGLRRVLQEMHPVADQIVVIDAGSTDGTPEMARELGAEVYATEDILPEQGNLHGRGESYWKSLAVLGGDILVWLDPRARRFHPSTAISLAGPLLRVPMLQFVKGFGSSVPEPGDHEGHGVHHGGYGWMGDHGAEELLDDVNSINWGGSMLPRRNMPGILSGRIKVQALKPADLEALHPAQLAALPPHTILQVLYPPLAGMIAPFGRDMAGRRDALLSLPAFIGDNLESGLLLSVATRYGTRAIAQVEMRHTRPVPPPQPNLHNALDILQVLAERLPDPSMRKRAERLVDKLEQELNGHAGPGERGGVFEVRALSPVERPPMVGDA